MEIINFGRVAQLVRASRLHREGLLFESGRAHIGNLIYYFFIVFNSFYLFRRKVFFGKIRVERFF